MTISNSKVSFYVDCLIAEAILSDDLVKNAEGGVVSQLIDKVKEYFSAHINPQDKVGSFLSMIAPGAIAMTLGALGFGWLGPLIGLALNVFHIDVGGILISIYGKIKGLLSGGSTSSSKVESAVKEAVDSHMTPATEEEAAQAEKKLKETSASMRIREAKLIKIAMIDYKLNKQAGPIDFLKTYIGKKSKIGRALVGIFGWIFKVALASAGLLVAGDIVNGMIGRPSALTGTMHAGKPDAIPEEKEIVAPIVRATQIKFKLNPGYQEENNNIGSSYWDESIMANENNITQMLIKFANEVYSGLQGASSLITSSSGFKSVLNEIMHVNRDNLGTNVVIIPRKYHSKRQIVDRFIDEVAQKS